MSVSVGSGPGSGFGFGSAFPSLSSACVISLGMIQSLFEAPSAICGSTWRYWYARRVASGLP